MSQVYATVTPGIELGPKGIHRTEFVVRVAMDRHRFALLPSLNRADIPLQVARDVLPRVQAVGSRRSG
jgi:hypothetical protein